MKHLVLVGLPGSGKTTVGRAAAALAKLPFLDFDEEIERRSGLMPNEFFARYGEAAFRAQEVALSRELPGRHTIVVAPGGGWIAQETAREALRDHAVLVYLKVTPAEAVRRLGPAVLLRPLLATGDPTESLTRILTARESLYAIADHVIDTEAFDIQTLTINVAAFAELAREPRG